jgi:hypothetical protein
LLNNDRNSSEISFNSTFPVLWMKSVIAIQIYNFIIFNWRKVFIR